jgi:hypothetical protein
MSRLESAMLEHARDEHPALISGIAEEQHEAMMKQTARAPRGIAA